MVKLFVNSCFPLRISFWDLFESWEMVCTFKVELIWLQQDGLHSYYYIYQQLNFNLEVYLTVTLPTICLSWSSQMWTYCKNQDSRSLEWMSKIWSWMQNVSHQMEAWEIPCSLPAYRITNLSEMTTKTETEVRKETGAEPILLLMGVGGVGAEEQMAGTGTVQYNC